MLVNQDKASKQIAELRAEIQRLKCELMHQQQASGAKSTSIAICKTITTTMNYSKNSNDSNSNSTLAIVAAASSSSEDHQQQQAFEDLRQENGMLLRENHSMRMRIKAMQETIEHVRSRNVALELTNVQLLAAARTNLNINNSSDEEETTSLLSTGVCVMVEAKQLEEYMNQIENLK